MTDTPHDRHSPVCGFCARVFVAHRTPPVDTAEATATGQPHAHHAHVHTRCCRSVRELLATLQHIRLDEHVRRACASATTPASRSFFWLDLHGCPCPDDVPLTHVWALLGVHARTQQRLVHGALEAGEAAAAAAVAAAPVKSMFDEHVYYEVNMDEPDTVQLLPVAGLTTTTAATTTPREVADDDDAAVGAVSPAYYVALQLAALMEQHVAHADAQAHSLDWMASVSANVSFADTDVHAPDVHATDEDNNNNNNDNSSSKGDGGNGDGCTYTEGTATATAVAARHTHNAPTHGGDDGDARAVDFWGDNKNDDNDDDDDDNGGGGGGMAKPLRKTVVTTVHVLCFVQGCVTWCPSSNMPVGVAGDGDNNNNGGGGGDGGDDGKCGPSHARRGRVSQHVKDWHKLQEAVLARLRRVAHTRNDHDVGAGADMTTTTEFLALLMSTLCYGFLPDATAALGEVDAIDAMLPTVVPEREAEQATALRRILVQRRRLSMMRRLLYRKVRLMEELDKPVMHTLAGFMAAIVPHSRHDGGVVVVGQATTTATATATAATTATATGQRAMTVSPPLCGSAGTYSTYDTMVQFVAKLDAARLTLGNLTLVYTSAVTSRNSRTSTGTDLYQLILQYMILTVLPLSMVASHWGMNCNVPWHDVETTTPFWGLTGLMFGLMLLMLVYPVWAYSTRRYHHIM